MTKDQFEVAVWRFEQISPLLDPTLTPGQRRRIIEANAERVVTWPSGRETPVGISTQYTWLKRYRLHPVLESLIRKSRTYSTKRNDMPKYVQYALALLEEEPQRSLYILCYRIQCKFNLKKPLPRTTLYRELRKEKRYVAIRNYAKGEKKIRKRFVAMKPHYIWHADAKAKFRVLFSDGSQKEMQVLTILDDSTRYVLRALIVQSESTRAAVTTFMDAAGRYGLPDKFYADKHSCYDSTLFRSALAILGVHRINTKPRNPSAHGKIESYHKTLNRWFVIELKHQPVRDVNHLQMLLDAVIETLYHEHIHRELKMSHKEAFNNTMSKRQVSLNRLYEAFLETYELKPDKKSGNVRAKGVLFRIPSEYLVPRKKLIIKVDVRNSENVYLLNEKNLLIKLKHAIKKVPQNKVITHNKQAPEPQGSLTPILENYRGRILPLAHAGFGLPEIYEVFSLQFHRVVPQTEQEAHTILVWLKKNGPFQPEQFKKTLTNVILSLGNGRPLVTILKAMETIIQNNVNRKDSNHDW